MRRELRGALIRGQRQIEFPFGKIRISQIKSRLQQSGPINCGFLQHLLRFRKMPLAEKNYSQKIVGFCRVWQLQEIPMQPRFCFLQLSLLNQFRDAGELGALRSSDFGQTKKMPELGPCTPEFSSNRGRAAFSRQQNCSTKSSR